MIVLIRNNSIDITVDTIFNWLLSFGKDCVIINSQNMESITDSTSKLLHANTIFIWRKNANTFKGVKSFIFREFDELVQFKINSLSANTIPYKESKRYSKLTSLMQARDAGLSVPKFKVCSVKQEIVDFRNSVNSLICKPIFEVDSFRIDGGLDFTLYAKRVDEKFMMKVPSAFFPSLFQEEIVGEMEIRTFIYKDKHYSSATFSEKKDEVDMRHPTNVFNEIQTCFELPDEVIFKTREVMKFWGLTSCSVDFLFKDGLFYFIDLNPVGQFSFLSNSCNYYIEKEIANDL